MSRLCWHRGTVSIKGTKIDEAANKFCNLVPNAAQEMRLKRDETETFHLTVVSAAEVAYYTQNGLNVEEIVKSIENVPVDIYGLGMAKLVKSIGESWYTVVHCEAGDLLRHMLQLPPKDFHITLGFVTRDLYGAKDLFNQISHHVEQDEYALLVDSICSKTGKQYKQSGAVAAVILEKEVQIVRHFANKLMEFPSTTSTSASNNKQIKKTSSSNNDVAQLDNVIAELRKIGKWFLLPVHVSAHQNAEILSDICHFLLRQGVVFGFKLLVFNALKCEDSAQSLDSLLSEVMAVLPVKVYGGHKEFTIESSQLVGLNLLLHHHNVNTVVKHYPSVVSIDRSTDQLDVYALPRNFSWVQLVRPDDAEVTVSSGMDSSESRAVNECLYSRLLAGCAYPTSETQCIAMYGTGIRHIITIHEQPICNALSTVMDKYNIQRHYYHVFDRTPPTIEQLQLMVQGMHNALRKKEGVVVHCQGGVGRTNTAIIAYLMYAQRPLSASNAIEIVRKQRKMILASSQEKMLRQWWSRINTANYNLEKAIALAEKRATGSATTAGTATSSVQSTTSATTTTTTTSAKASTKRLVNNTEQQHKVVSKCDIKGNESSGDEVEDSKAEVETEPANSFGPVTATTTATTAAVAAPLNSTSTLIRAHTSSYRKIASCLVMPPVIMFCGLAASGKSTLSKALVKQYPDFFTRVNKDEMRGKGQCDNVLFDTMRKYNSNSNNGNSFTGIVLLDNCNLTKAVRRQWINSVHGVRIWCVYLNMDVKQCKQRIQYRVGHPTIPPGPGGIGIIDSMMKQFEAPTVKEGFDRVIELRSEQDVLDLCVQWNIDFTTPVSTIPDQKNATADKFAWNAYNEEEEEENLEETQEEGESESDATPSPQQHEQETPGEVKLLKFPRTPHMMNLGAATRDDKVMAPSDLQLMVDRKMHLVIEEKLDGANMGISIDPLSGKIMVQNRSHYISAKYHPQFQPLDNWLVNHSAALYTILTPGRHILYGEWLYATHSVYYNKLPDYFIAYDLYDRVDGKFFSRKRLVTLLENTNITVVPLLHVGTLPSVDAILAMVHGPSAYIQENALGTIVNKREGCVVRVCENGRVVSRAKLVRHDFIAGNERWNKTSKLSTNQLNYDL